MGGGADFALNFTPGVIAGLLLEFDPIITVLLGGVTYISSSGIVAKLVADLDRIGNQETPVILSILVIEDLAVVLYLPLVSGVLFGNTAMSTTVVVIGSLSAIALRRSSEALLLTLLGIALLVAGIAGHLNGSTAVGAFIVGVALSGKIVSQARGLLLPLRNLFAAIFFVFLGLQVDPRSMAYGLSARRARQILYRHRRAGRRSRTQPRRAFSHLRHLSHAHRIAPLPILGLPHAS